MATTALVAFAALALLDWVAVATDQRPLEYFAKPATLSALIVWAATGEHASTSLLLALGFSLLGDVCLMFPARLFLAGVGAFFLGHVAYIVRFAAPLTALPLPLGVGVLIGPRVVRAVREPRLRVAIIIYMLVLSPMLAAAIGSRMLPAIAGALLFFASDTMIAWSKFVQPFPGARLAIIVTYHVGQWALTAALR